MGKIMVFGQQKILKAVKYKRFMNSSISFENVREKFLKHNF